MPAVAYFARIDQAEVYVVLRLRESKQNWVATVEVSTPVTIKFGYRIDRLSAKEKVFEIALADLHSHVDCHFMLPNCQFMGKVTL